MGIRLEAGPQVGGGVNSRMRYKAFLSYSHTHREFACALQDALHRLGTPWYERTGPRIFRDESSLGASPDLWEVLRVALDESEYFIYLASPQAAASFWIQKEVAYWLDRRGPAQLLIALVNGSVTWNDDVTAFDAAGSNALPAGLLSAFQRTPLFVDLRGFASTRQRSSDPLFHDRVATIASTLHGKSKDELYGMQAAALAMSDAARMANDAQIALGERLLDRALLLGAQALRLTEAHAEARLPDAELALRAALARGGGRSLGEVDNRARPPCSMSSDGRWLCTVHSGEETRVWDLHEAEHDAFQPLSTARYPTPEWLEIGGAGNWLVAVQQRSSEHAGADVCLWRLRPHPPERVPLGQDGRIVHVELNESGEFLALSVANPPQVLVWHLPEQPELEPGCPVPRASLILVHDCPSVASIAFSPSGVMLTALCDREVRIWDVSNPDPKATCRVIHETAPVASCRVSPGGDFLLLLTNQTPCVLQLDADSGHERTVIQELDGDIIHHLQMSPDGRWGLLVSDTGPSYGIELRRPTTGFTVTCEGGDVGRHAFSENGCWLATAAGPYRKFQELQVNEPEYVARLRSLVVPDSLGEIELRGHDDLITALEFSPNGNVLATCSLDRTLRLWDLGEVNALSKVLLHLLSESDPAVFIRDFELSAENIEVELSQLLETVRAELQQAAQRLCSRPPQVLQADDAVPLNCKFSGDNAWLVSIGRRSDGYVSARLWDTRTKSTCAAPIRLSRASTIDNFENNQTLALSPDQRWLFVLGECSLWELRSASGVAFDRPRLHTMRQADVAVACFSRRSDALLLYDGSSSLAVTDLTRQGHEQVLDTGVQEVQGGHFTINDRWFVALCGSSTTDDPADLRLWPLRHLGEPAAGIVLLSGARPSEWETSPGGRWLLAWVDNLGHAWDLSRDDPEACPKTLVGHRDFVNPIMAALSSIQQLCWVPDERHVISAGSDGLLLYWDLLQEGGVLRPRELHAAGLRLSNLSADWTRRRLFVGGEKGHATLLTIDEQGLIAARTELPGLSGEVSGAFSPSGRWLSVWDDNAAQLFDLDDDACRAEIRHEARKFRPSWHDQFSPDERWWIVAREGRLFLVELGNAAHMTPVELFGHRHPLIVCRVTSDSRWLISIDRWIDKLVGYVPASTCRIWDLGARNPATASVTLPDLERGVDRMVITDDDRWLITSSRDGVRMWPLGTQHLIAIAERCVGRPLSDEDRQRYAPAPLRAVSTSGK